MRFVVGAASIQTVCIGMFESMGKALYATYYYFHVIILVLKYLPESARLSQVSTNVLTPALCFHPV